MEMNATPADVSKTETPFVESEGPILKALRSHSGKLIVEISGQGLALFDMLADAGISARAARFVAGKLELV